MNYAGKIISDNKVNSMEAGFLNYWITPYIGLLIKKTTCNSETGDSKSKICLEFKQPDSNLKKYKSAFN